MLFLFSIRFTRISCMLWSSFTSVTNQLTLASLCTKSSSTNCTTLLLLHSLLYGMPFLTFSMKRIGQNNIKMLPCSLMGIKITLWEIPNFMSQEWEERALENSRWLSGCYTLSGMHLLFTLFVSMHSQLLEKIIVQDNQMEKTLGSGWQDMLCTEYACSYQI